MAFAYGTPIKINPTTSQAIETIMVGDTVFAADYTNASQWSPQVVEFSNGTGPGSQQPLMVYMTYEVQNNTSEIIVTPDQPFLLSTNKVQRADRLIPGDNLVSATGESFQIVEIEMGQFQGGIHDVAITTNGAGHWIVCSGVVCGDFTMQINLQPDNSPHTGASM